VIEMDMQWAFTRYSASPQSISYSAHCPPTVLVTNQNYSPKQWLITPLFHHLLFFLHRFFQPPNLGCSLGAN
ncbi:uncharacterized protein METZ01_LOCUS152447, partial [marine metagenome]